MSKIEIPNLLAKGACASGPECHGPVSTGTDVMVSFYSLIPYNGNNRPSGDSIDEFRTLDIFLYRKQAERLYRELGEILSRNPEPPAKPSMAYRALGQSRDQDRRIYQEILIYWDNIEEVRKVAKTLCQIAGFKCEPVISAHTPADLPAPLLADDSD